MLLILTLAIYSSLSSAMQIDEFTNGTNDFSLDLHQELKKLENVAISSYSISTAFSLLSQAANGNTYHELKNTLHLNDDKRINAEQFHEHYKLLKRNAGSVTLAIVNQIYVQEDFRLNQTFQKIAAEQFFLGVAPLNFRNKNEAAEKINNFVKIKTNKKITNFLNPDDIEPETCALIVNAIHFKGDWESKFDSGWTRSDEFYSNGEEKVWIDFMKSQNHFVYGDFPELDATAIDMKYANSNFSFMIVLPKHRNGLPALESKMKRFDIRQIRDRMKMEWICVSIPKFTIESDVELKPILKKMGLNDMFDEKRADFSGLLDENSGIGNIFVSQVIHKAFVHVNEKGTEAEATTGVRMMYIRDGYCDLSSFNADHPFMFAIWDNASGTIIFSGRITTVVATRAYYEALRGNTFRVTKKIHLKQLHLHTFAIWKTTSYL